MIPLTPREYEVTRLFALGLTWEQVMAETGIRRRATVNRHRQNAMAKADAGTMQGVWASLGWLVIPRASASDVTPSAGSWVAMTGRPQLRGEP